MQKERLGDAVKRIREENGWSLADVRAKSGFQLATSYVSRIENNQVRPEAISTEKLQALAKGLGKTEEYISALARGAELKPSNFEEKLKIAAMDAENFSDEQKARFLQTVEMVVAGIRAERQKN